MHGAVPLLPYEVLDFKRENLYLYQWAVCLNGEPVYVIDKPA
jgi:hypothetical protein